MSKALCQKDQKKKRIKKKKKSIFSIPSLFRTSHNTLLLFSAACLMSPSSLLSPPLRVSLSSVSSTYSWHAAPPFLLLPPFLLPFPPPFFFSSHSPISPPVSFFPPLFLSHMYLNVQKYYQVVQYFEKKMMLFLISFSTVVIVRHSWNHHVSRHLVQVCH